MDSFPKSGHFYANKVVRLYLLAIEEVIGKNGLNATLNMAHLSNLVDNYPPENLDKEVDFADFSTLNLALEEIYGAKGGRLLGIRAGKIYFESALRAFGEVGGLFKPEFTSLPPLEKLRSGLAIAVQITNQVSDQQVTLEERENDFVYSIHACPACWGRSGEAKSVCAMPTGFLLGCVNWLLEGKEFLLIEEKCMAVGDDSCQFVIRKPTVS